MNYGVVSQEQLEKIDEILTEKLIKIGVDCVIIIDMAGNIITAKDNGTSKYDVYSFAALAAGNFATVDAMAKLVGEQEFSLLFHKGTECNIHFSKIDDELLLIIKTSRDRFDALRERLPMLHPHELPELVAVEAADGLAAYLDWVRAETRPAP